MAATVEQIQNLQGQISQLIEEMGTQRNESMQLDQEAVQLRPENAALKQRQDMAAQQAMTSQK